MPSRPSRAAAGVAVALALVAGAVAPPAAAASDTFTLVVLPDTQNYVSTSANEAIMGAQTRWVAAQRDALDVAFVSQVGDLVGIATSTVQWERASRHMAVLDAAGVPSAVLPGNHDMDLATGAAPLYRQHFPVSRYAGAAWNGPVARYGGYLGQGQFGPDAVDRQNMDSYALFTAGGMDFLLLSLEFNPSDAALAWARRVLAAHPDRRAVVATHSYLDLTGAFTRQVSRADGGNSGQDLWDDLVRPSCSVFLVVSGHFSDAVQAEARRTDTNACGRPVHAVLTDYQDRPRGGDGWLRLYTFDPAADQIRATTYSPTLDRYETDADSAFVLPYDMTGTPPAGPLAADAFGRAVGGGWGAADVGGAWALSGTASRFAVAGGAGAVEVAPGAQLGATLTGVATTAADVRATLAAPAADAALYATVSGRVVGTGDLGARVKLLPGGDVELHAARSGTVLAGGRLPGVVLAPGARLRVRVQVDGTAPTRVRVRAWPEGVPEPTGWHATATDSTAALQRAGGVRLSAYLSSSASTGPAAVRWDDLLVTPPG